MKSSSQKTFNSLRTILPVSSVLIFVLISYPAPPFTDQFKVVQAISGSTLQPDSWNPRNDAGVCAQSEYYRIPKMAVERAQDAFDIKAFVANQSFVDPNRIAAMGWSHGGWTVLKALRTDLTYKNTKGPFKAGIAFYPYCTEPLNNLNAPLIILQGVKDKWAPAETCTAEMPSGKTKHEVIHHIYPDAYHDFDWPGLDETYEGQRLVYNPTAAQQAIKHVKDFLEKHLQK